MSKAGVRMTAWSVVVVAAAGCTTQAAQARPTPAAPTASATMVSCADGGRCLAQQAHLAGAPVLGPDDSRDRLGQVTAISRGAWTWQVSYSYHHRDLDDGLVTVTGVHGNEWAPAEPRNGKTISTVVRGAPGRWIESQRVLQWEAAGWRWGVGFPPGTSVEQAVRTAEVMTTYQ